MTVFVPHNLPHDLAADQWGKANGIADAELAAAQYAYDAPKPWVPTDAERAEIYRRAQNTPRPRAASPGSLVKREDIGPNAEAWLRDRIPAYREARERQERTGRGD